MKKMLSVLIALTMVVTLFSACGKEDEVVSNNAYSGILTRVKLGMPSSKVISLQPDGIDLYYETDTSLWCINNDTELEGLKSLISADNSYFYADDSIITYNFETRKGDNEMYLNGYMSEVTCLIDRKTANDYFKNKTAELAKKHGVEPIGTMTGTENIDMELTYTQKYDCPSYTLAFIMTEKYDTVNGVDGYYGSYFSIELIEKEVKQETAIGSDAVTT